MKHRFETEKRHPGSRNIVFSLISFAIVLFLFAKGTSAVADQTDRQEAQILEQAINRGIVHCYTIEGAYPESLQHLKDGYGLIYDEERFFVDYQALGSNLMPKVTIIDRRSMP